MNAEEIALEKVHQSLAEFCKEMGKDPESDAGLRILYLLEMGATFAVQANREAGLLLEWRTDMENVPRDGSWYLLKLEDGIMLGNSPDGYGFGEWHWRDGEWAYRAHMYFNKPAHFAIINPPEQTND